MNQVYLAEFIQFLCLLPAAAICFLPVKNQLKYSAKTTAGIAAGGIASLSLSTLSLGVNADLVFFAAIIMCFMFYYRMVKCGLGEKLAIFFLAIALSSFMSDYAIAVDARIHPTENRFDSCVMATGADFQCEPYIAACSFAAEIRMPARGSTVQCQSLVCYGPGTSHLFCRQLCHSAKGLQSFVFR